MQQGKNQQDWTVDPRTGRANSSKKFNECVQAVSDLIRDDAHFEISVNTAVLVVAQLAHVHGLAPNTQKSR